MLAAVSVCYTSGVRSDKAPLLSSLSASQLVGGNGRPMIPTVDACTELTIRQRDMLSINYVKSGNSDPKRRSETRSPWTGILANADKLKHANAGSASAGGPRDRPRRVHSPHADPRG